MLFKVERFITIHGYEYKSDITNKIVKANYTFGLLLRKLYMYGEYNKYTYILKQEDLVKNFLFYFLWLFYGSDSAPVYNLYENNIRIGNTENCKGEKFLLKTEKFNLDLIHTMNEENHIITISEGDSILAEIKKNRLRYWKKNLYSVIYDKWNYDIDLLILLTALCDVIFFPEWTSSKWSAVEYDLK